MRDLEKFWGKIQEMFFIDEVSEIDYSDFLDIGEECGLLKQVPFDPKIHNGDYECEPGEMIYLPVPPSEL